QELILWMQYQLEECDEIGNFSLFVEARTLDDVNRNAVRLEGFEINVDVRHRTKEQRDFFPRLNGSRRLPLLQQSSDRFGFHVAALGGPRARFRGNVRDAE